MKKLGVIAHVLSLFTIGASIAVLGFMSAEAKDFFDIQPTEECVRNIEQIPVEMKIETIELPIIAEDTRPTREERIAEAKRIEAKQMDVYDEYEIALMAKVVHAEAGNQNAVGKRLIADVILNRIDSPLFPNTVEEVVNQKNQFAIYQWYTIDDLNAVTDEIVDRTDNEILFFRTGDYHDIGEPAYQYGDHYFSTMEN